MKLLENFITNVA